jgi:predicted nucleotidyltransferase component of viral defense system
VRYASAGAFRRALETRLNELSRATGRSLVRLRKEVVFDRLLVRLLTVAPDRWLLKGALALDYRFGDRARTTKDIDLVTSDGEASATADLLVAKALDLGDFFRFSIERTAALDQLLEGAAVRYHVRAELAGRVFDEFVVDVGFDFPTGVEPEALRGPDLLAFADLPPVEVPALPLELQVAEKLHAYGRLYGSGAVASTRVKDLVDLALIAREATLDANRLRAAIEVTFARRGTTELSAGLPRPPSEWRVPYSRLARDIGLKADLSGGYATAVALLDPVLRGEVRSGTWQPASQQWSQPRRRRR